MIKNLQTFPIKNSFTRPAYIKRKTSIFQSLKATYYTEIRISLILTPYLYKAFGLHSAPALYIRSNQFARRSLTYVNHGRHRYNVKHSPITVCSYLKASHVVIKIYCYLEWSSRLLVEIFLNLKGLYVTYYDMF